MTDPFRERFADALAVLERRAPFRPDILFVLGSGLADVFDDREPAAVFSPDDLPDFPRSGVAGHRGDLAFVEAEGRRAMIARGRTHLYEGRSVVESLATVWLAWKLGARAVAIGNAAGGVSPDYRPGDLMLASSFNAWFLKHKMRDAVRGTSERATESAECPSPRLNRLLREAALDAGVRLEEGVYFYTSGPSYETPAEVRMIRRLGGDAVGMSSAHEALFAARKGMEVASISVIANKAAGLSASPLSHTEVTTVAAEAGVRFANVVDGFLRRFR
jgi:purine-nucleoside phosphorylase